MFEKVLHFPTWCLEGWGGGDSGGSSLPQNTGHRARES